MKRMLQIVVVFGSVAASMLAFGMWAIASGEGLGCGAVPQAQSKIAFTATETMGEIVTPDGVDLGFSDYKARDGKSVQVLYNDFTTPARANEVFGQDVARAAKVVTRGKKLDAKGNVVGERAQVVVSASNHDETYAAILWTDGKKFHEIISTCLRNALDMERVYKH